MPSLTKHWVLIDAGANPDSEPAHLVQNAIKVQKEELFFNGSPH